MTRPRRLAGRWAGRTMPISDCRNCSRHRRICAARLPPDRCRAASSRSIHLAVARHWGARYPWFAQVRASLGVGIDQATIDAINARKEPNVPDARERTCFTVARELLANKGLSDATYAAAEKTLGEEHLVAASATTGAFSMTCMTANSFNINPPAENPTPLAE